MTLTIDLGNTRAKLTIFDAQASILEHHSVAHDDLVGQLRQLLSMRPEIRRICWCAVGEIPAEFPAFLANCRYVVQQLCPTAPPSGITLGYRTPATLGADRLAAVMGAQSLLALCLSLMRALASLSTSSSPMVTTWAATSALDSRCACEQCTNLLHACP